MAGESGVARSPEAVPVTGASEEDEHDHLADWFPWAHAGFIALLVLADLIAPVPRFHNLDLIALAGVIVGGFPIFKEAIVDLLHGHMTMELSMTIALIAAAAIGEFRTALVITFFVLVAEILEGLTVGRGRRAISWWSAPAGTFRPMGWSPRATPSWIRRRSPASLCRWK